MELSGYAQLAVRLANAACGKEKTGSGTGSDNISTVGGLCALLTDLQFPSTRATRSDLDAIGSLHQEYREIFTACADGDSEEAVRRLNGLLIRHPVHPSISGHDGQPWHLHLTEGGCVADRYAAASAMGLAIVLTQLGADRFGICQAASCGNVFADTGAGRTRRRRCDQCTAKGNVTALRSRRRPGGTAAMPTAAV
ncbi:MAG TPA: ABATE domain-containing protein [Streptosporangiaceae bacterium]